MIDAARQESTWRLGYRPALDGLRGLAVVLVVLHHAGIGFAQTGYLGVTLFFVLSGFLITTPREEERQRTGRVRLRDFYERRVRRLFPALITFTITVSMWLYVSGRGGQILGDAGPTLLYFANIPRAAGVDMGLFDHTWSLALEEQFYLVWPTVFVGVLWRSRAVAIGLLVSLALAITIWRFGLFEDSLYRVAFGPGTRADAILLGCALGLWATSARGMSRVPAWVAWPVFAIAVILSSVLSWQLTLQALPLFAIASVGAVAWGARVDVTPLAWPPLVRVGAISYGLYLWHAPLMREGMRRLHLGPVQPLMLIFLSIAFAELSFRFVEQPFRHRRSRLPDGG